MWSNVSNLIGGSEFLLVFHKEKLFFIYFGGWEKQKKESKTNKQTNDEKKAKTK